MNVLYKVITLLVIMSCASFSENFVKEGRIFLNNGRFEGERWSDNLEFQRVSWFQELTLLYDLLYWEVDNLSPFYKWFDEFEKKSLSQCSQSFVVLNYALDSSKISKLDFFRSLENYQTRRFSVGQFRKYLANHPDYERFSLSLYEVSAICLESKQAIEISFPNFRSVEIF